MDSVLVLLSSYNGECYISEQIDSILAQVGVDVHLLIRDDGSSDNTVSIITNYVEHDSRVKFYQNGNLGCAASFFDIVKSAPKYSYYAFCDQDDYWHSDKLKIAVEKLKTFDESKPNLYLSNQRIVDEKLNLMAYRLNKPAKIKNCYTSLVEFIAVGCTEVFNYETKRLIENHLPCNKQVMHDAWVYISCNFFGNVYYDFESHIDYRQHSNNVIGYKTNKYSILKERLKRLSAMSLQPRVFYSYQVLDVFGSELSGVHIEKLNKIVHYKKNIISRLSLLFDFQIKASSISRDLRYRFLIIWGLI